MWAIICNAWGGTGELEFKEIPEPGMIELGVRIGIKASGVNFADSLIIEGKYQVKPQHPFSPGLEVAGVVLECSDGVTRVKPGDRVMAMVPYGGFAEQVVANESDVFVIPDTMDFVTAAGFPVTYGTSYIGLKNKLEIKPGENLLITGASGGVGLTAVELAKLMGANVIGAAGGPEKLNTVKLAGADHTIDYLKEDVRARVKIITEGKGVDAVFEPVGGDIFESAMRGIAQMGRILVVGFSSGQVSHIPANILLVKNITVIGYYWGAHRILSPRLIEESFVELIEWYQAGKLSPVITDTFDLEDADKAIDKLKNRKSKGKLVLKM